MGPGDVRADLPQGDGEQVQLLEPYRLIAGHQHPAPLLQLHQVGLHLDGGGGDGGALGHGLELFLLTPGLRGDGAVVHPVDFGDGGGDVGEDIPLLHPLADGAGDVLGEEHRGVGGAEEGLHRVAGLPLHLDVEPLELPLKGVQPLQAGALIPLAGVLPLQHLAEGPSRLPVHPLVQLQIVVIICHVYLLFHIASCRARALPLPEQVFALFGRQGQSPCPTGHSPRRLGSTLVGEQSAA